MQTIQRSPIPQPVIVRAALIPSPSPAPKPRHRWIDQLTVLVFALFLGLPLAGFCLRTPTQPTNENRPLHPMPASPTARWKVQAFPPMFDQYFNDRVGYRNELLDLRRSIVLETLGDSPSDLVWVGREGWLFMNVVGPHGLPVPNFDPAASLAEWATTLRTRHDWLAARGIRYIAIVAPEKSSVYPEYLPAMFQRHPPPEYGSQLRERIGDRVPLVEPRPGLLQAKFHEAQLYYHHDSHWTDSGAFVAYRELGNRLEQQLPGFRAKSIHDFVRRPWMNDRTDLAQAVGRPQENCREAMDLFTVPGDRIAECPTQELLAQAEADGHRLRHLTPRLTETASGHYRAVLLHDSFGGNLQRMLAGDFRRLAAVGTYSLPVQVIEAEQPDVVIQLFVARTLVTVPANRFPSLP